MPILLKNRTLYNGRRDNGQSGPSNAGGPSNRNKAVGLRAVQLLCLGCLVAIPFQGSSYAFGQQANAAPTRVSPIAGDTLGSDLILAPGDLIDLEVFNTPELSVPRLRVSEDGFVAIPVLGNVKVSGLKPLQANVLIEQRLRDAQIMSIPSVSVLVIEHSIQGVDVLGEVRNPGIYTFQGTHTLFDALAAAGGVSLTQGATIKVTHRGDPTHPVVVQVDGPNYTEVRSTTLVAPGDVVEVMRADSIFVVGDVVKSGQIPIVNGKPLTALNALALAQGPNKQAKLSKCVIVRKSATGVQVIPINFKQIEKAQMVDPILLPDDVMVIPHDGVKAVLDIAIPGVLGAVIAAVVYSQLN